MCHGVKRPRLLVDSVHCVVIQLGSPVGSSQVDSSYDLNITNLLEKDLGIFLKLNRLRLGLSSTVQF